MGEHDAAGDPGRLLALSDGVFAIAVTLLVLDVGVRDGLDPAGFRRALRQTVPELLAYALSFTVIAAMWRDHRRIFAGVRRVDEVVIRLTVVGLGLVALMPFPTTLLADYGGRPQAVLIYSGAVVAVDAVHLWLLRYLASRPGTLAAPRPKAETRLLTADLTSTIAVFVLSMGLAYVSPTAAKWCWLLLVAVRLGLRWARGGRSAA